MKRRTLISGLFALAALAAPASAGDSDPLFINMTTDDSHRALMAIGFGVNQHKKGHPVAIFFNDRGVLVASTKNAATYGEQQKLIAELIQLGGEVIMCPMCSKKYGVPETDFMPGAKLGNPDKTGALLFRDNGKTLTW